MRLRRKDKGLFGVDILEKTGMGAEYRELSAEVERLTGKEKWVYWTGKRLFDIVASFLGLIVLILFFIIISLLIIIDDPHDGPLYFQKRVGRRGKVFTMWKFRSMVKDAELELPKLRKFNEADGPVFKMLDDPRITRIGKCIRKTSIDELPQLVNILLGQMTFVGPRPALPEEVAEYTPYQRLRLAPTPGLTCLWQTSRRRHKMPFDEWVKLDIEYIQNRSWGYDLKLIFRTLRMIIFGWSKKEKLTVESSKA